MSDCRIDSLANEMSNCRIDFLVNKVIKNVTIPQAYLCTLHRKWDVFLCPIDKSGIYGGPYGRNLSRVGGWLSSPQQHTFRKGVQRAPSRTLCSPPMGTTINGTGTEKALDSLVPRWKKVYSLGLHAGFPYSKEASWKGWDNRSAWVARSIFFSSGIVRRCVR